ncbi:hypothetical protein RN001_011886 [Aquatica leii]|uniref:SID1 transmembrane family member 1 n=1 Tax=Aquatica leii TaxID=1421715 RepID=A0AAN7PSC5_9COLE|nr:hypothetical protein RN001_011886 [Aquatica leii]
MMLLLLSSLLFNCIAVNCIPNFEANAFEGNYSTNIEVTLNHNKEHVILFKDSKSIIPYTVYVWSVQTEFDQPIFVVIRQQRHVTSWQIPYHVATRTSALEFTSTSKTLCHNNMDLITQLPRNRTDTTFPELHKELSISLSTSSRALEKVFVRVEEVGLFYIKEFQNYNIIAAVSHPRYYYYQFPDVNHEHYSNTVILEATSEDTTCMTISIQNASCPMSDNIKDITFNGMYQTVQTKGGIIIKQKDYPNGFFIVFLVKGDNSGCNQDSSAIPKRFRVSPPVFNFTTVVNFQIKPTISTKSYYVAAFSVLGGLLIFYVIFFTSTWGFYRCANLWRKRGSRTSENISIDRLDITLDTLDSRLASSRLKLSDLARKDPRHFEKKSYTFLWHVVSIAIFYGIPVVQLVVTYQRVVNASGNLDVCYYNFLCAHPAFNLSDFNHIYSNIGYIFMGLLFVFITLYRHKFLIYKIGHGIPKHYGLFYAMGVALIMEGILSASYHVCPNQSNFQFDTSFMYVMAALCMVQLYQKRHPDINATAYATFVALGIAIFAAMVGVLNGHISLWITFIVLYIVFCLYVSCNIYFISYVKIGLSSVYHEWYVDRDLTKAFGPKRKTHFIILLIANIINIILACMGIACYYMGTDFATFLLGILMGNTVLYALVYIIMKLVYREKICMQATIYGVLGLIVWGGAMYFFMSNTSLWNVSAAESKKYNQHCIFLDFYDNHDVWHLLSAVAMFFSFMLLLTMDDDLINTPHSDIMVF